MWKNTVRFESLSTDGRIIYDFMNTKSKASVQNLFKNQHLISNQKFNISNNSVKMWIKSDCNVLKTSLKYELLVGFPTLVKLIHHADAQLWSVHLRNKTDIRHHQPIIGLLFYTCERAFKGTRSSVKVSCTFLLKGREDHLIQPVFHLEKWKDFPVKKTIVEKISSQLKGLTSIISFWFWMDLCLDIFSKWLVVVNPESNN